MSLSLKQQLNNANTDLNSLESQVNTDWQIYPDWQAHEWPSPPSGRCAARRLLEASKQQQHQQQQQTLRSPFVQMNPASK